MKMERGGHLRSAGYDDDATKQKTRYATRVWNYVRVERERNKKRQEKFYRGPRLECERWLWWLELGDGVPFAPGGDPAGKTMSRFDRGGETDPDDL